MADSLHPDPAELVRRCLSGDDAARAEFISAYDGLIRRAIARRIQRTSAPAANAAHLDDIANEVYIRLFTDNCRALASLRHTQRLAAWLVTVSQNQTITYLRKAGASHSVSDKHVRERAAPDEQSPEHRAMAAEMKARVSSGLAQLDYHDCLVLQMFYLYNLRYADIAETLDMNINTVASRIMRAKRKLKSVLREGDV
jgi:RNA polymerase sigma-70 factor (ECF subfamily)